MSALNEGFDAFLAARKIDLAAIANKDTSKVSKAEQKELAILKKVRLAANCTANGRVPLHC